MAEPLGLRFPTDHRHQEKYPLTISTTPRKPTPVVLGIRWYASFDTPEYLSDGRGPARAWIGLDGKPWGSVRGGHAVCLLPRWVTDSWWQFYDQGVQGACAGFSSSRMMSLLNRRRYDGFQLYREAQRIDEWDGEDYSGTSLRAVMDVLRDQGHWPVGRNGPTRVPLRIEGIKENRWATSVHDIASCLSPSLDGQEVLELGYVVVLNSWGTRYPRLTRLPLEALDRLVFQEDGEATVVTDR